MLNLTKIQADTIGFSQAVVSLTRLIPSGKVLGYGQLAALIGKPKNARQVGTTLKNMTEKNVPWWRVLRSDGSIAMQGSLHRGSLQRQHLLDEKVYFNGQNVNMNRSRWLPEIT